MSLGVRARKDYIIAKVVTEEAESEFARVDSQPKQQHMEALSVGPDVEGVAVGDRIMPHGVEFQAFVLKGEQYIVLRDDQVLGVFDQEAE